MFHFNGYAADTRGFENKFSNGKIDGTIVCTMKRRIKKDSIRKITRTSKYTCYATLPKNELVELGCGEHQKVTVRRVGKKLIAEDWKKR